MVVILTIGGYYFFFRPNPNPPAIPLGSQNNVSTKKYDDIEITVENLEVPWDMAFLPNGSFLVTERPGRVQLVSENSVIQIANISEVKRNGESGLHGVTIDPEFDSNKFVYLYYTYSSNGQNTLNKVVRYRFENNSLIEDRVIIDEIPGAIFHDGGRIRFGPDNYLYVTTGDAREPSLAQDRNSLAGKILRLTRNGEVPPDNPFESPVYSYGHRNPQGIVWDDSGQLWATEHGESAHDEVNRIRAGGNYGWPEIEGSETRNGMITPVLESGSDTWAPAGMDFLNGKLYFVGLRGAALYSFEPGNPSETFEKMYEGEYGRLRNAVFYENGLYVSTSNRDGRGVPQGADDKIIRLDSIELNK